jgi:8-oxo-dGTP pyrophosphatase MutT (NUDIX family)
MLLRDGPNGFEVLMVERNSRGFFGGMVVFPGGRVDQIDVPDGMTTEDDLSHRNAAIRELAEETGILLTRGGAVSAPESKGSGFYEGLPGQPSAPDPGSLVLVSRWVTPEQAPRRFDTRFYLVGCDNPPEVRIDTLELVGHDWMRPADALEAQESGDVAMILPTISHLRWLARRSSITDAISAAGGADGRTSIEPRRVEDGSFVPIHLPVETS